jgi:hypothetical protein
MRSRELLVGGMVLLVVAHLCLATATSPTLVSLGAAFWGAHMAVHAVEPTQRR